MKSALRRFSSFIAGSSNGRTMDSESINPGSNPGPAVYEIFTHIRGFNQ